MAQANEKINSGNTMTNSILPSIIPYRLPDEGSLNPRSTGAILAAINSAASRDIIVDLSLRYFLRFAKRAAFLIVKRNRLKGFAIAGKYTSVNAIKAFWLPADINSTATRILNTTDVFSGQLDKNCPADRVIKAAFSGNDGQIMLAPFQIAKKPCGLFYADKHFDLIPEKESVQNLCRAAGDNLKRIALRR